MLKLDSDPKVRVIGLTTDFTNADGILEKELSNIDALRLSLAGYAVYGAKPRQLSEGSREWKRTGETGIDQESGWMHSPFRPRHSLPCPLIPLPMHRPFFIVDVPGRAPLLKRLQGMLETGSGPLKTTATPLRQQVTPLVLPATARNRFAIASRSRVAPSFRCPFAEMDPS